MSDREILRTFEDLKVILDEERRYLLLGEYSDLEELAERKTQLLERIMAAPGHDREQLAAARSMARQNGEMLDAALSGIRDISRKMAEFQKAQSGFETYNRAGKKSRFPSSRPVDFERRA